MNKNVHALLVKLYFPFIIFIVLPMVLLNFAIFKMIDTIKNNDYESNLSQTHTAGYYLSNILSESISSSRRIVMDSQIKQLTSIKQEKTPDDYENIMYTSKMFKKYSLSNSNNYNINIFYTDSSIMLSNANSCSNLEYFYGSIYRVGKYSFDEFKNMSMVYSPSMTYYPSTDILINSVEYRGFFYTIPINQSKHTGGMLMTIIYEQSIKNIFASLKEEGAFNYITDINGKVLWSSDNAICDINFYKPSDEKGYVPTNVYGKEYIASYVCLPEGINVFSIKPYNSIIKNTNSIVLFVLILNIVCILCCIGLGLVFILKNDRKLSQIFSMLKIEDINMHTGIYDIINCGIKNLMDNNRSLSTKITSNIFLLRAEFWNKLLNNRFSDDSEIRKLAANADINLNGSYLCLVVIAVKSVKKNTEFEDDNWVVEQEVIKKYREEMFECLENKIITRGYVYNIATEQTVLILQIDKNERERYKEIVKSLFESIPEHSKDIEVVKVVSRIFSSLTEVHNEYLFCNNILLRFYSTLNFDNSEFLWIENECSLEDNFYFPQKLSDQLLISIKSGDAEAVKSCYTEMLNNNFNRKTISSTMSNLLINKIKIVLMEAYSNVEDFNLFDSFKRIDKIPSDAVKMSHLISLSNRMCESYFNSMEKKQGKLKEKITAYIAENVTKQSFCLTDVAAYCGFSESYFSLLFREIMNTNFSTYIEKLKMEFADNLIRSSEMKIEEIAIKTGYSDANTFRRAYKKYFSVSPSSRREHMS